MDRRKLLTNVWRTILGVSLMIGQSNGCHGCHGLSIGIIQNWHGSIKMTLSEAVYCQPPPRLLSYIPGITKVDAVDDLLRSREQILILLQQNLQQAQQRMKKYADLRSERTLEVGHQVYLHLQPCRQNSVVSH
jgi:hypothetical protein